jgi:hypothetical protein
MESDGRSKRPEAKKSNRVQKPENRASWQPFTVMGHSLQQPAVTFGVYTIRDPATTPYLKEAYLKHISSQKKAKHKF